MTAGLHVAARRTAGKPAVVQRAGHQPGLGAGRRRRAPGRAASRMPPAPIERVSRATRAAPRAACRGRGRRRRRRARASSRSRAAATAPARPSSPRRPGAGRRGGRATARRRGRRRNSLERGARSQRLAAEHRHHPLRRRRRCARALRRPPRRRQSRRRATVRARASPAARRARRPCCGAPPSQRIEVGHIQLPRGAMTRTVRAPPSTGSLPAHRPRHDRPIGWRSPRSARTTWPRMRSMTGMRFMRSQGVAGLASRRSAQASISATAARRSGAPMRTAPDPARSGMERRMADRAVIGWDIGGAHVKACLPRRGLVHDVAQWPCPLWQGAEHLDRVLALARERWPDLAAAQHAVTMTGEMVDRFAHREDGVQRIAQQLAAAPRMRRSSSQATPGGVEASATAALWPQIASANWLASARHTACALAGESGLLVDIGSTTTDLIAFHRGVRADHQPQRRAAAGQRRTGLPGRRAYTAVRARAAHRLARRAAECDERVLCHHGRRVSPHRRTGPGTRPAAERRPRGQGSGRHLRSAWRA